MTMMLGRGILENVIKILDKNFGESIINWVLKNKQFFFFGRKVRGKKRKGILSRFNKLCKVSYIEELIFFNKVIRCEVQSISDVEWEVEVRF